MAFAKWSHRNHGTQTLPSTQKYVAHSEHPSSLLVILVSPGMQYADTANRDSIFELGSKNSTPSKEVSNKRRMLNCGRNTDQRFLRYPGQSHIS